MTTPMSKTEMGAPSLGDFVLVPREPTEAMAKASRLTVELPEGARVHQWGVNAWSAMLAAAPPSEALAQALATARAEDGWRDIATAPKDGSEFLAWPLKAEGGDVVTKARWYVHPSVQGWVTDEMDCNDFEFSPTHWMPLPAPPTTTQTETTAPAALSERGGR